ncbi:MAG: DUF3857 domain-containing protein [Bacteroidetes bacterium]|nr:DUF3857 domain-containing protein [Bacteroidota bacterium]
MTPYQKITYTLAFAGLCLLSVGKVYGQDIPKELYSAAGIPDSLKENANSIVRYSMDDCNVEGPGKMQIKHHSLITILNEKGDEEAIFRYSYNRKYDTYRYIDIHVYDENGKIIKKYHKGDMYDGAATSYETLISDDRILELRHAVAKYPETIEVEYEEDMTSNVGIGSWLIQQNQQAVQNSSYQITIDKNAGFKYFNNNTNIKPGKSTDGNMDIYTWGVSNLRAFKLEEGGKAWRVLPKITFSQDKFNLYGNPGDISSWQNYGKWQLDLNSDVCSLSPARTAEIKKMTDTIRSDKDKARFLYHYLQENTRYVSIQLGIGGFKPFPATFVDDKKYGDCKGLVNYMYAMLKAAGINSYYAIVNAGTNAEPANPSFPYDYFNHIILCIPFKNDTTWLECTNNHMPFGVLGTFTENRNALLVTEDGGKLVNTPKSTAQENQFNSEAHIDLQADGSAKTHVKILSTGEYRWLYLEYTAAKLDEQKQFWMEQLGMKQPNSLDIEQGKDINGVKQIDLNMDYDKFCDVMAADKQFYQSSAFKLCALTVPLIEKRKFDYYFEHPMQKSCVTTIELPQGYEVESLPPNASLKFTYGTYDVNYTYNKDKNQVVSTAKFVLNNQVIPAAKYNEMQQFMDAVTRAENKKLVLHKKA